MVERLKMVLEGFAANGYAFLKHQRCFDRAERVALNGVRRPGKLDVVEMLQVGKSFSRQWPDVSICSFLPAIEVNNSSITHPGRKPSVSKTFRI